MPRRRKQFVDNNATVVTPEERIPEQEPEPEMKSDNIQQEPVVKKRSSKWNIHVKEFRKVNPNMTYKQALQEAKKTYKR